MGLKITKYSLFIVSFLEGGALMAIEIISSKLLAPNYGTSIYAWAAIFTITLLGLATGYFIGGKLSGKQNLLKILRITLLIGFLLVIIMPWWSAFAANMVLGISFKTELLICLILFLFPPLICFGVVSPIIIQLLTRQTIKPGRAASLVFGFSTFGGVICTFYFGFYSIPYLGLINSCLLTSGIIGFAFIVSTILNSNA